MLPSEVHPVQIPYTVKTVIRVIQKCSGCLHINLKIKCQIVEFLCCSSILLGVGVTCYSPWVKFQTLVKGILRISSLVSIAFLHHSYQMFGHLSMYASIHTCTCTCISLKLVLYNIPANYF